VIPPRIRCNCVGWRQRGAPRSFCAGFFIAGNVPRSPDAFPPPRELGELAAQFFLRFRPAAKA
jgi:hypothetical protein